MKRAVSVLLLLFPTLASAEATAHQEFSFLSSFLQMIAALSIVIGLILLTKHFSAKYLGGTAGIRPRSRYIRVVETRFLSPKKSLILVEVGGEYLLLSSTDEHIRLLKTVDVIEDIEVVEEPKPIGTGFAEILQKVLRVQKG